VKTHHLRHAPRVALNQWRQRLTWRRLHAAASSSRGGAAELACLHHVVQHGGGTEHVRLQRQLAGVHLRRAEDIADNAEEQAA